MTDRLHEIMRILERQQTELDVTPAGTFARILGIAETARAIMALDGWRPIETAPRGEMFIYYEPRAGKRCIGLAYLTVNGEWRDSEGEWHRRIQPTHWMPFPSPPAPGPQP